MVLEDKLPQCREIGIARAPAAELIVPVSGSMSNQSNVLRGNTRSTDSCCTSTVCTPTASEATMLTSELQVPELWSIRDIDRDIVACEVALVALSNGGPVFDPDREGLRCKLLELLELRLQCERGHGTILRFAMRENANRSDSAEPAKGLP